MRDYLTLSSSPINESCQQVGTETYEALAVKECQIYLRQLERLFPDMPFGMYLKVKAFPHDGREIGSIVHYHEVVVFYDDGDEVQIEYAFRMENEMPEYWDEEAIKELIEAKIPFDDIDRESVSQE